MFINMIDAYLNLLGLDEDATFEDVKKAYRSLAKENHPDKFASDNDKERQKIKMAEINEAYQLIIKNIKKVEIKSDYEIYKTGIKYFEKCYEGLIVKMEDHKTHNKTNNLQKAKKYFEILLNKYPESDWVYDSEEKLKKINNMMANIDKEEKYRREHKLSWTKRGTPYYEKKKR